MRLTSRLYLKECYCALNNAIITEHFIEKRPQNLLFKRHSMNLCLKGGKLFTTVKYLFNKKLLLHCFWYCARGVVWLHTFMHYSMSIDVLFRPISNLIHENDEKRHISAHLYRYLHVNAVNFIRLKFQPFNLFAWLHCN